MEEYIKTIDNILDYAESDNLLEFSITNRQTDLERITILTDNLLLQISFLTSLIKDYDLIRKLLNNLEKNFNSYSNLAKKAISIYLKLLVDLYETTKDYKTIYLIHETQNNPLSHLPNQSFDDKCFSETIFDNKFISTLKNSQN